jgi:PAS domain S-box-containing protein
MNPLFKYLSPPDLTDEGVNRKANFLYRIILGTLGIITVMLVVTIIILPEYFLRYSSLLLIFWMGSFVSFHLMKKGHVRLSSFLYVSFMFVIIFASAWTAGGIKSHAIQLLPIVVLFAGLTLGRKAIWYFGLFACVVGYILVLSDRYHVLPRTEPIGNIPITFWIISSASVLLLCTLEFISIRGLENALDSARQELALRTKSEEKYRHIFESFQDIYYETDLNGYIHTISPSVRERLGYEPEIVMGRNVTEIYADPDRRVYFLQELKTKGTIQNHELDLIANDGNRVNVLVSSRIIYDENMSPIGIKGTIHDITERKLSELALRVSEERYKSIISVSNTGGWEYHTENGYLWCSPEYFTMLGRSQSDYKMAEGPNLQESWVDLLHPDDRDRSVEHFASYLRNGSVGIYENNFRMLHQDGSWIWIWSRGQTLRDSNGVLTNLTVGTHIDVTKRNQMEVQLQQLNAELEERVIDRTRELEEVNKELESFSFSVSHDLRAPLRAVNGYATILEEDFGKAMDPEARVHLQTILKNSKRMGQLIDDLLAFSKLGRKDIATSEINMNVLVGNIVREEIYDWSEQTEFVIHDLLPALGDQSLIKQVWINLISNACKYSRNKPNPRIEIGSALRAGHSEYYIKDNGAGFDMQYYHKLFGVFQRLHSQDEFEGTGIGLASLKKIISKHHGKVWAESVLNEGTIFYFTLRSVNI